MATMTISLPETIVRRLNEETVQAGFATRSEFIRALLRRYFAGELQLEVFTAPPIEKIKLELARTGKYSQKFIDSVTTGLAKSSAYREAASSAYES